MPSQPRKPVNLQEVLEKAYRIRLKELDLRGKEWVSLAHENRPTFNRWVEHNPVVLETQELEGWVYPENDLLQQREKRAQVITQLCDKVGMPYDVTAVIRRGILKRRRGAPIKPATRRLAILALEKQRNDVKFSWMRFALTNCDCPKRPHDSNCKERIRLAARDLQSLLDRLEIEW